MSRADVLLVSLASTPGLREADDELAASLRRAGAEVALARVQPPRAQRTMALHELAWARAARKAAETGIAAREPRAVIYSSTTAALLWPRPGVIRFDSTAASNRPGRHGLWQRPAERQRFAASPLLLPWSERALAEAPPHRDAIVVPVPVRAGGPAGERDIAAVTYAANPDKKGTGAVIAAWGAAARPDEVLVVVGQRGASAENIRFEPLLPRDEWRSLLGRSRLFVTAPAREDHGIAQLEALADGCMLVTTPAPGPYVGLEIARDIDPRLVTDDLRTAIRLALDDPVADYGERSASALAPFAPASVDALVEKRVLPALLA